MLSHQKINLGDLDELQLVGRLGIHDEVNYVFQTPGAATGERQSAEVEALKVLSQVVLLAGLESHLLFTLDIIHDTLQFPWH